MTQLEELVKIRKLLAWLVRDAIKKQKGADFEEKNATDVVK